MAYIHMVYVVMVCIVMVYIAMARRGAGAAEGMRRQLPAYIVMAYIVMAT